MFENAMKTESKSLHCSRNEWWVLCSLELESYSTENFELWIIIECVLQKFLGDWWWRWIVMQLTEYILWSIKEIFWHHNWALIFFCFSNLTYSSVWLSNVIDWSIWSLQLTSKFQSMVKKKNQTNESINLFIRMRVCLALWVQLI